MFTYQNWDYFCSEVKKNNLKTFTARDVINNKSNNFIIIKHDVETNVAKALELAKIENKYGINTTYYVQSYLLTKENLPKLSEIQKLGHELTYHYDVLDSNNGDWEEADREFNETLNLFKENDFIVETVCPHGNPIMERKGWSSNKDFFRNPKINDKYSFITDIVVDVKDFGEEVRYISDAGYGYKLIADISNNDRDTTKKDEEIKDLKAIIHLLKEKDRIILSTHPHRWGNSEIKAKFKKLFFFSLRAIVRFLTKNRFLNKIIGKFYYLAKKYDQSRNKRYPK
ncbi:hypothetical protein [Polaribacter ponticola]|uniref:Polysaccharide deacetylase n=1 Tax=Polaribacter ponticola TaxID=2978475 RepID=A0ABT5S5K5_9FLAO|nr:hypothetical protein [Polaribacter sp. MSW5]MDD7913386.1 hypothetical protein [Polaribacter sp. MSW5]